MGALNFMSNIGNMMVDMEMHELLGFVVSVISPTNKPVSCSVNLLRTLFLVVQNYLLDLQHYITSAPIFTVCSDLNGIFPFMSFII